MTDLVIIAFMSFHNWHILKTPLSVKGIGRGWGGRGGRGGHTGAGLADHHVAVDVSSLLACELFIGERKPERFSENTQPRLLMAGAVFLAPYALEVPLRYKQPKHLFLSLSPSSLSLSLCLFVSLCVSMHLVL